MHDTRASNVRVILGIVGMSLIALMVVWAILGIKKIAVQDIPVVTKALDKGK